jgi:hypothetical protein
MERDQPYRARGEIQPKKHRANDETPPELRGPGSVDRPPTIPASDIKELVTRLTDFTMDELKQVPVIVPGSRLEQGARYVDLTDRDRDEFTAVGAMIAAGGRYFAPKKETPTLYWNRLIGARPGIRRQ